MRAGSKDLKPIFKPRHFDATCYICIASFNNMRSHELAKILLEHEDCEVTCSVDISTCDADADSRVFGDLVEINSLPTDEGFGSSEAVLLFVGSTNQ